MHSQPPADIAGDQGDLSLLAAACRSQQSAITMCRARIDPRPRSSLVRRVDMRSLRADLRPPSTANGPTTAPSSGCRCVAIPDHGLALRKGAIPNGRTVAQGESPCGATWKSIDDDGLPNARPIALSDYPRCRRCHSSVISAAVKPRRYPGLIANTPSFPFKAKCCVEQLRSRSFATDPFSAQGVSMSAVFPKVTKLCGATQRRDVPKAAICTAANSIPIRSPRRRVQGALEGLGADSRRESASPSTPSNSLPLLTFEDALNVAGRGPHSN